MFRVHFRVCVRIISNLKLSHVILIYPWPKASPILFDLNAPVFTAVTKTNRKYRPNAPCWP